MSRDHEMSLNIALASEDHEDIKWIDCAEEMASASFSCFNDFRSNGHLMDVVLEVGEKEFKVHKVILASTIPFFKVMFTTDMVEAHSAKIRLPNIDADTMESIINFAYTGRIKLTSSNIERVLKAADYLQLTILSSMCADILKSRINERNVFSIRSFAIKYNIPQVVVEADCFIQRQFIFVSKSDEFVSLDFATLMHILDWDQLHVDSEERVFEAVIHWLEFDVATRHVLAPKLLTVVRMPLLRPQFLIDEISKNPLIWNSLECRDLVDQAKNFHLIPERRKDFNTIFKTTNRMCTEMPGLIYALGGITQIQPSPSSVEIYDPAIKRWALTKPMLSQRTRIGVAVSDGKIYAVGGYNGVERLRCAEVFDTKTGTWTQISSLHKRRSAMCAIALGESVFVIGGYDGSSALDSVESLEIKQQEWTMKPPMLSKRCAAGIAIVKGLIYVIGGHNGLQIFNSVECYDPVVERWTTVQPMHQPRCRLAATAYQNKIYVAGGYHDGNFLRTAEVYDPDTNAWAPIASMNLCRARVSLVTNGNLLYAIGGYDGENNLISMEIYNPAKNQWEFGATLVGHEGGVGAVVVPNMARPKKREKERNLKRPHSGQEFQGDGPSGGMIMKRESEQME